SVYFAFFKGSYSDEETDNLSKIIAFPITAILITVLFYTLYDYYLLDALAYRLKEHNSNRDYKVFLQYEFELKNKIYENAREELSKGNLDNAYNLARKSLFYEGDNGNILLLLKSIQKEREELEEIENKKEMENINNLIQMGSRAFSMSDYNAANRYFDMVLTIDRYNSLALYYLNRISMAQNSKPKYSGNTTEELYAYKKLAEIITLYEEGRLWEAYEGILPLYAEVPNITEVRNYYSIITDAINNYDFFIEEASEIRNVFIDNAGYLENNSLTKHKGLNLMLDKNTMLSSINGLYFKNNLYIFDVSVIKLDDNSQILDMQSYKYGKLANTIYTNTNNIKNIILKAPFDNNKKDYIYSDTDSTTIPISISSSAVESVKNYTDMILDYASLSKLILLKNELPKFGYSNEPINLIIFKKAISPILYLLLFVIIAYYSFKFREEIHYEGANLTAKFIGIIGTLSLTMIYGILTDFIATVLIKFSNIVINIALVYAVSLAIILIILLQISRIPKNVK
ncbi:hypothetical protein, partial [Brachyspira catarrhinii]|uniref:hypothetical protein n=1 Tax=Brachyspira catarrhinii TaxID=2528966 RepID=UPI0013871540